MKIAFIVDTFPSLSQTFILNQITGLLDRGHKVDIYARHSDDHAVIHADVERYNLQEHTFYYRPVKQVIPANVFLRFFKAIGLIIANLHKKPLPLFKSLNVLKFGKKAASLRVFYRTVTFLDMGIAEYDVVHCHFGPNGNLGALLKEVGAIEGKVLTTFYGYDISRYTRKRGEGVYTPLFEQGDMILSLSERMKSQLIQLGCCKQKVYVHGLGVDTGRFIFLPRQLRDDDKVHLLTIARLVEKKGVECGIRAVAKVLQKYPQIEYKIAGDGPLKSDLETLINMLGISGRVKLLGWKRQAEIIELLRQADILLAPSVTAEDGDQEGTPTVLMEALAQGLPVLSTQHSGIPELVQDGESGFLVPERDVDALAERLEYLITHPEIWPEMGRAGRDYVERYHDINKLNDQLVTLYQRLLTGEDFAGQMAYL